jgi:SNF2 family DNA or RNA helicase
LCACHPALVDDVADFSAVPPATKHEALVAEMLELQAQGHHALVFSQFVRHLRLAQRFLVEAGLRTLILTGETPTAERQKLVERFQAGEADVFLISLKAGGFAFLDKSVDPGRRGDDKDVHVRARASRPVSTEPPIPRVEG